MIRILYTTLRDCDALILLDQYRTSFTDQQVTEIRNYRNNADRNRSLLGKLLLREILGQFDFDRNLSYEVQRTKYNRPYLKNHPIDFNISHSGQYIMCIASDKSRVGVDVEEMKPLNLQDFKPALSESEWRVVQGSQAPQKAFYRLWSIKESVLKAEGRGLLNDLSKVQIFDKYSLIGEERWKYEVLDVHFDYMSIIAYQGEGVRLPLQKVTFSKG